MSRTSHINVTIDFTESGLGGTYDLRIPVQVTAKQLLLSLIETLKLDLPKRSVSAIKVQNKNILIADDDLLVDYPVTDGDVFIVL